MNQIQRMVEAGIPIRLDAHYLIQHDKAIVVDDMTTETGSFNFTESAERFNSENAIVIWNMPDLAHAMLAHRQSRWDFGEAVP